jgi:hypothetical protein
VRATAEGTNVRFSWDPSPGADEYLTWWDENRESGGVTTVTTEVSQLVPASYDRAAFLFEVAARGRCGQST